MPGDFLFCQGTDDYLLTKEVLAELKEKDRQWYEIIVRVAASGEKQKHVASDLGISLSNLRIKQHRAKQWLRDKFNPDDYSS